MKQACANCHTMHNSQNDAEVVTPSGLGQLKALLNKPCYECHTGVNSPGSKPMVLHIAEPIYPGGNTLAGGDFFWVSQGADLKGHNVEGIVASQDTRIAPGGSRLFNPGAPLSCAGWNGCHGKVSDSNITDETAAMSRTHHSDDTLVTDGSTLFQSFRFLSGVEGKEDPDYELTVGYSDHNQYKGVNRSADNDPDTTTISHSCARCHGDFHFGAASNTGVFDESGTFGADPWIRHPVDFAMNGLGGEYAGYGGVFNDYQVETPLASDSMVGAPLANVFGPGGGDAIITCISCHRAHGSPYDYSLRWDYASWPDAGGYNGCGDCHTLKKD